MAPSKPEPKPEDPPERCPVCDGKVLSYTTRVERITFCLCKVSKKALRKLHS